MQVWNGYNIDVISFLDELSLSSDQNKSGIIIVSFLFISDLNVGQYMTVLIEEVKNDGRVVRLSQDPQALGKACAETQQGWTLDTLLPGLLIQARIKRVSQLHIDIKYNNVDVKILPPIPV